MLKNELKLAWRTFSKNKLRTFLTMIAVFISIAAVVSLISLSLGLQESVIEQFRSIGSDKIFITPGRSSFGPALTSAKLLDKDIDVIEKVEGVKETAAFMFKTDKIYFNKKDRYYFVSGFPTEEGVDVAIESLGASVEQGRIFEKHELNKVVIGWKLANDDKYFGRKMQLGDTINIKGNSFEIIGVFQSRGNDGDDTSVFIPLDSFKSMYDQKSYDWIIIQAYPNQNSLDLALRIEDKLRKSRDLKKGEEDFAVQTFDQLLASFGTVFLVINIFLVAIASISLIVAGVGIMNTMYTAVLERRKDIGIMKSVGATNGQIMKIFLVESALLGIVGGGIGLWLGLGLSTLAEVISSRVFHLVLVKASYSPVVFVGAFLFSVTVGIIGGILPAMQASKMHPVDALRK